MAGYIKLYRQIQDNFLWTDKPFARGQAWVDLLMMANYHDADLIVKGEPVHVPRGTVYRTQQQLADRWGWSVGKVRRFIKILENAKMCTANGTAGGIAITIENYSFYNDGRQADGIADGIAAVSPRYRDGIHTNKNKKNKKKKKAASAGNDYKPAPPQYQKLTGDDLAGVVGVPMPEHMKKKYRKGEMKK